MQPIIEKRDKSQKKNDTINTMNEADLLWKGVQLCIGFQLIAVGLLNLFNKKVSTIILGLICIVVSSYFFKTIYWKLIDTNALFTFVFSGALFCFYGQLLYLYIVAIEKKLSVRLIIKHFSLPLVFALFYSITRTFFYSFFNDNNLSINILFLIICIVFLASYFYLGIQKFKISLDHSLVFKAKKKYTFFYYAINIFLLNQFISAFILVLHSLTENSVLKVIDTYYMSYFSEYLNTPLYAILSLYLIFYALSQSKSFKSFFLNEQEHINQEIIDGKGIINQRIETYFYDDKIYRNSNLKIKDAANKIGVSEKILAAYLQNELNTNFKDFINTLRVNEFKSLLNKSENKQYSLLGISEECGFKSKATFYRVFKNKEGITPNEYFKSL